MPDASPVPRESHRQLETVSEIRRGAAEFDAGVPGAVEVSVESEAAAPPWWRKTWLLGALGAAAVVALVVAVGLFGREDDSNDVTRGGGLPPVTLTQPAEGKPFERVFTWRPVKGATAYHLVVYNAEGARAFEVRDLTTAGVKMSDGLRMIPGRYSVEVTALREGAEIAKSEMTPFDMK